MDRTEETSTGISVVICTRNGAGRLRPTLEHLAVQRMPHGVPWEVIVVDNGSDDNTQTVVRSCWPVDSTVPLHIILEPEPGKVSALIRGMRFARYPFFCILDDDNWLCPDYLALGHRTMKDHPEVAICGGNSIEALSTEPPLWFDRLKRQVAVGPQGNGSGYVPVRRGYLRGAGSVVRREVYLGLLANGFSHNNDCHRAGISRGGEDTELCAALTMLGWKLWYEPGMVLHHSLPPARLTWASYKVHNRSLGRAAVGIDPYRFARRDPSPGPYRRLLETWQVRILYALLQMGRHPVKLFRWIFSDVEGDEAVLHFWRQLGKVQELWHLRGEYVRRAARVRTAPWRTALRPGNMNPSLRGD